MEACAEHLGIKVCDMCADMCKHVCRHVRACADVCVNICGDVCGDICTETCEDTFLDIMYRYEVLVLLNWTIGRTCVQTCA